MTIAGDAAGHRQLHAAGDSGPGVHADLLGGAGTNAGLGNQAIFANGQRDTSNSFSLNGVSTNNLFNGNSSSQVGENRFVLNTGENFRRRRSRFRPALRCTARSARHCPRPPVEAIQEIAVNAANVRCDPGGKQRRPHQRHHKIGHQQDPRQIYEYFQNSAMNAAPFFYNASPAITVKDPFANRNQFGATLGGPIKKDKLFYFRLLPGSAHCRAPKIPPRTLRYRWV